MSLRLLRKYDPFTLGISGSEPDEDEDKDGENASGEGGSGDQDSGSGEGSDAGDKSGESAEPISREEFEKVRARMVAADKRAAAAEKKAQEYEDKDKDELTKATERATALQRERDDALAKVQELNLRNAFLSSNEYAWEDPDLALKTADLDGVLDPETGEVDKKALKAALKKVADAKPFLVKKTDGGGSGEGGASGAGVGSSGNNGKKGLSDAELRRKYPALQR